MLIGKAAIYEVKIEWVGVNRVLAFAYTNPPVREDVAEMVEPSWRASCKEHQDNSWEFILILDLIPEIPWLGTLTNVYGSVTCTERIILLNEAQDGGANKERAGDAGGSIPPEEGSDGRDVSL